MCDERNEDLSIRRMVKLVHACARAKGWWQEQEVEKTDWNDPNKPTMTKGINYVSVMKVIPEKLMLIVSELAEALEDYRESKMEMWFEVGSKKPCGFPSELADAVIRIADLAGALGIDLESAIEEKMAYNETRPYRHGGKRA